MYKLICNLITSLILFSLFSLFPTNTNAQKKSPAPAPAPASPSASVENGKKDRDKTLDDDLNKLLEDFAGNKKKEDPDPYSYIMFGSTSWMSKNLNTATFRNGDIIPESKTNGEWKKAFDAGKPTWCYYNFDAANGVKYGKLYNFFAVQDERELAPAGWHIPSDKDWKTLSTYFKGVEGKKMKSSTGWNNGGNGTNIGSFWALPGGYFEDPSKSFSAIGSVGRWWSSGGKRIMGFEFGNYVELSSDSDYLSLDGFTDSGGLSIRCIKN